MLFASMGTTLQLIPSIKDLYERHCLVLCPVMKTGQTALDSVGVGCSPFALA